MTCWFIAGMRTSFPGFLGSTMFHYVPLVFLRRRELLSRLIMRCLSADPCRFGSCDSIALSLDSSPCAPCYRVLKYISCGFGVPFLVILKTSFSACSWDFIRIFTPPFCHVFEALRHSCVSIPSSSCPNDHHNPAEPSPLRLWS